MDEDFNWFGKTMYCITFPLRIFMYLVFCWVSILMMFFDSFEALTHKK
jgi:hypothetical protein